MCDRVLVMYGGSVVDEQEYPAAATEESLLSAAHGLQEEAV